MLLVLLNWLYILFVSLGLGLTITSNSKKQEHLFLKTVLYGLFLECVFTHFWAFFGAINTCFYAVNVVLCTIVVSWKYPFLKHLLKCVFKNILEFGWISKLSLLLLFVITLAQSSSSPFVFDNESYYIQTIKWINEYGFVNGLANLHVYMAQTSGWHVLQSAFSFPFLQHQFNDLNGFLYVLIGAFSVDRLKEYSKKQNFEDGFIGILPVLSFFFYLFIDAPSPDLPLFLISQLIIYFFLKTYKSLNSSNIFFMFVMCVFLCLIKVIVFPILLLPLVLVVLYKRVLKESKVILVLISIVSLIVFATKNYIISGYPFFPLSIWDSSISPNWKLNNDVLDFYIYITKFSGYQVDNFESLNRLNLFVIWIKSSGIDGFFNKLIMLLLVISPFLMKIKSYRYVYLYCAIQFLTLFFTSPQYRFLIPIILFLGLFLFLKTSFFLKEYYNVLVLSAILLSGYPVFFGLNLERIMSNNLMNKTESFSSYQIVYPKDISKYSGLEFETLHEGNLEYHSPIFINKMFYQTSKGKLPTVHKDFVDYLKKYYHHQPQLRVENSLKDGFFSKSVN